MQDTRTHMHVLHLHVFVQQRAQAWVCDGRGARAVGAAAPVDQQAAPEGVQRSLVHTGEGGAGHSGAQGMCCMHGTKKEDGSPSQSLHVHVLPCC